MSSVSLREGATRCTRLAESYAGSSADFWETLGGTLTRAMYLAEESENAAARASNEVFSNIRPVYPTVVSDLIVVAEMLTSSTIGSQA